MGQPQILSVEDIHTYYGESYILQGVNLSLDQGGVAAVLGRNGVGKTTLIRSLIGFSPPRQGKISFRGKEITRLEPFRRVEAGLALVPQGRRIFGSLSVEENLLSSSRKRSRGDLWDQERVYGLFPRLLERKKVRAAHLSGGEQQMLAIARALVSNPALLLLDEPTEGLSPIILRGLADNLHEFKKLGMSVLLVEQNLQFALEVAESVYILSRGKVVYQSTGPELSRNPDVQLTHLGVARH
jgi:branched-chain amino acid transport system ATP-binding protein